MAEEGNDGKAGKQKQNRGTTAQQGNNKRAGK